MASVPAHCSAWSSEMLTAMSMSPDWRASSRVDSSGMNWIFTVFTGAVPPHQVSTRSSSTPLSGWKLVTLYGPVPRSSASGVPMSPLLASTNDCFVIHIAFAAHGPHSNATSGEASVIVTWLSPVFSAPCTLAQ